MRIVVMCPAVRGAMGYHLNAMAHHYPAPEQMIIYVPDLFDGENLPCTVVKYPQSRRSASKLVSYFNPLWARRRF
ncbi:hypothetical protein ABTD35_22040, partial [Acinetobacter baumannii]